MRVKAFTLVEITVGLLIGSIVIMLAAMSFVQLQKLHLKFQHESDRFANYERLHYLLNRDLGISKKVLLGLDASSLSIITSQIGDSALVQNSIDYRFEDQFVTRQQDSKIDTFGFNISNYTITVDSINKNLVKKVNFDIYKRTWTFNRDYPKDVILADQLSTETNWQ